MKALPVIASIAAVAALLAVACSSTPGPGATSPKIEKLLGTDILAIVQAPDAIECFTVKPKKESAGNTLLGFPIVTAGPALNPAQVKMLQGILLNEKTYEPYDMPKRGFLFPEYAFKLKKGSATLTIFVDMSRKELSFFLGATPVVANCDTAHPKLVALSMMLFPRK